jgi:hypothetical protein
MIPEKAVSHGDTLIPAKKQGLVQDSCRDQSVAVVELRFLG